MIKINEISTNRLLTHFTDDKRLAIISTFRTERTEAENMKLLQQFKAKVRADKFGFTELKSRWAEMNDDGTQEISDERSLIVYGLSLDQALEYGKAYQQASIIFKDKDKCAEICTTDFTDWSGKSHTVGNIVQVFNIRNTKTPFNLNDAKDIFEQRKGGPVSIPLKSNRPFTLCEMFEVESPRGATFSTHEKYMRIF